MFVKTILYISGYGNIYVHYFIKIIILIIMHLYQRFLTYCDTRTFVKVSFEATDYLSL